MARTAFVFLSNAQNSTSNLILFESQWNFTRMENDRTERCKNRFETSLWPWFYTTMMQRLRIACKMLFQCVQG